MKISVIIPVYNEEGTVCEVLRRLMELDRLLPVMEILVIDDGSKDGTMEEVGKFPSVCYMKHKKNRGKGAAIRTGIAKTTGEVIVIQDADLEYSPSDIPSLLEPIMKGLADVVYGSRFKGKHDGMSFSHFIGNKILSVATRILYGVQVTDVMTGYKLLTRKVLNSFELTEDGFMIEVEITSKCLKNGWRFSEVPINYIRRRTGISKIRYLDGIKCLWKLITERI